MERKNFINFNQQLVTALLFVFLLAPIVSSATDKPCGERDEAVHKTCKAVKYVDLPSGLKSLMAKKMCDVKTGSSYDYGYAVDLNLDGQTEYAFCCQESGHGPCGMTIFGMLQGKWKVLYEYMYGFEPENESSCAGFVALKAKHSGYSDICINDGVRGTIAFKNGKYRDVKK